MTCWTLLLWTARDGLHQFDFVVAVLVQRANNVLVLVGKAT